MLLAPVATFFFYSQQTFRCGRHREVVTARRGSLANSEGQRRGERLDAALIVRAIVRIARHRRTAVAG